MSPRRLLILIEHLPPESAYARARARDAGDDWTLDQHLLAMLVDQLAVANWQRTKDGQRGRNKPKPVSPLARRAAEQRAIEEGRLRHYGGTVLPLAEGAAYLAQFGPQPTT